MFIRPCYRKKDGRRHAYWALVESYRTERGPRQRTVAYLGQLDEADRLGYGDLHVLSLLVELQRGVKGVG